MSGWMGFSAFAAAPGGKEKRGSDSGYHGGDVVVERLQQAGLTQTIRDYLAGDLDFRHLDRFTASMEELERRESFTDVKVAPFIRAHYRDRALMLTHNHPHPDLVNDIAAQISARLDLRYSPVTRDDPLAFDAITLPEFGKVFTPYAVRDLGLRYDYDLQWARTGREFITQIAETSIGDGAPGQRIVGP